MTLALAACVRRGKQPAASISSASGFDLVGDPVPVADSLQGDRSTFGHVLQECLDGAGLVINPGLLAELPILIENSELRVVLAQP